MTGFSSAIGSFGIGQSPIQGYLLEPIAQSSIQVLTPAYLYEDYQDDADLQAFFSAYNSLAQEYLDWFNQTPLAIYTSDAITGALLDWIGAGVYGIPRPTLSAGSSQVLGPMNTFTLNSLQPNQILKISAATYTATSDDIYKRIITWNFHKGDGNQFTISWLKRRIMRFLIGANGMSPAIDQTYDVSVTIPDAYNVDIVIHNAGNYEPEVLAALAEGISSGALQTPFQYAFAFPTGGSGFGEFAFGIGAFGG
jgi:hypothetical protein